MIHPSPCPLPPVRGEGKSRSKHSSPSFVPINRDSGGQALTLLRQGFGGQALSP
jgi:hypothetical protein